MKTTMDARMPEQPLSRLWTANYTRAWVANFLLFFSFMLMTPLFPVYLSSEFGADKDTIGWVMAGYSITAVLARFVSGYLVDSFPRMVVLVVSYLLFTVCTGAYLLAGSLLAFAVLRTLHGAPFGATTVANSTVAVELTSTARHCLLTVTSPGEPIAKEELKNIFKRFYRADKARAMNGSYGLGLSIAESIVQAHKGKIWAESGNGCNLFRVQLPTNN